jgi:hypothetical protein
MFKIKLLPGGVAMENPKQVLDVLTEIKRLENTLHALYDACSSLYPGCGDLWEKLKEEEKQRAKYVDKMSQFIAQNPHKFMPKRNFTVQGVRTVIVGVENYIQQAKDGKMTEQQAVSVARDIEHSLLETNFHEIVTSSDAEYDTFLHKIATETENHRSMLDAQIQKYL